MPASNRLGALRMMAFANPWVFMKWSGRLLPWLTAIAMLALAGALWLAWRAPADYQQGDSVRIMFVHVPAAWLALFMYAIMTVSALGTLVWRHPLADVSQRAAAPVGMVFTLLCLITGSIWGKPMWGAWWVWDARLTSVLVLFLMYCGVLALWRAMEDPLRAARAVAILTIVGFINVPIIKFSVDWWNTLHQPASVLRLEGPAMHPAMLWPLLAMAGAMSLVAICLHMAGMRTEVLRRSIRTRRIVLLDRMSRAAAEPVGSAP